MEKTFGVWEVIVKDGADGKAVSAQKDTSFSASIDDSIEMKKEDEE